MTRSVHTMKEMIPCFAAVTLCAGLTACARRGEIRSCRADAFRAAESIVVVNAKTPKTPKGDAWYRAALTDLTNSLNRVTGANVPVYEEGREPTGATAAIYFGETEAARKAGLDDGNMRRGDWRVKTAPGKAFLYAKTGMGASFAMTDFVETYLDYRFLTPYTEPDYTPNRDCVIPVADIVRHPVIYQRNLYHGMYNGKKYPTLKSQWEQWSRRRQCEWTDEIESECLVCYSAGDCHSIHNYLPPEKHFKEHPEWYSMGPDGKRRGVRNAQSQICYSNPEVQEEVYKALLGFVEKEYSDHPDRPSLIFDMTQMDNSDFLCLCPECKRTIAKYNRVSGGHKEGGDAGLQLEFVNNLARRIGVKYPKVRLRVFAYVSTGCAPKPGTIVPEPNVVIWWCDVYGYSCHLYPLESQDHFNMKRAEEIGDWLKIAKNVQVWDYILGAQLDVVPDAAAADARFYSSRGLPAIFMESQYHEQSFFFLNYYVLSSLYVDPSRDVDTLIRQFCRAYGKGADDMEKVVCLLRKLQNGDKVADMQKWQEREYPWSTVANNEKIAALCESAYKKAVDQGHLALILLPLKNIWNELLGMYKKDPTMTDRYAKAQEMCRRIGRAWAKYGFIEPEARKEREAEVDEEIDVLTLRFSDMPPEFRDVPERDIICVDYHTFYKYQRRFGDVNAYRQCAMILPPDRKMGFPISCGVYDWTSKDNFSFRVSATDLPADGKYHWVRNGRIYLGRNTKFWFGEWDMLVPLSGNHIFADGLPVDPNWYEMWSSLKVDGPIFISGSKAQNTVRLDRMLFRRIAPPEVR